VPDCFFASSNPDGAFLMLLEDLVPQGSEISDGSWAVPGRLARAAVAELADLHVRYEGSSQLDAITPWAAAQRTPTPDFVFRTLRHVIDNCGDQLSDPYLAIAELFIDHHEAINDSWDSGPETLIHGDAHIGNLFIDGDRVGFLDWGMVKVGTPMRDLSFFLTMGIESDDRRRDEKDLIEHYLSVRRSLGGSDISFDYAWLAHRIHAAYTVIASFLTPVPPSNIAARKMFTSQFRARAMAAIDDLNSLGALRGVVS